MMKSRIICILLLLVGVSGIYAQSLTVTGKVVDNEGLEVIGGNVTVKGKQNTGTITDINGRYTITVSDPQKDVLVFSFIGLENMEVVVKGRKQIDVTMKAASVLLDEVVAIGYATVKRKDLTGSVASVRSDDLVKVPSSDVTQALAGRMAGVQIIQTDGQPGATMSVRVRGGISITQSNEPLYIIDGFPTEDGMSSLDPADIESIDVLKDAASAAIYGAQAANGVVLVTTKSGKEGTCRISYDGYAGWQTIGRKYSMLNASEYMNIMDEARLNSGMSPVDWASLSSIRDANGNIYDTDWIDQAIEDGGLTTSHNLSFTGGSKTSTYAISGGYTGQDGLIGGSDVSYYKRYNFRVNSEHKMWNGLVTIGEHVSFVYKDSRGMNTGNIWNNNLRSAFSASPIIPVYDADGNYNSTVNSDWNVNDGNPYGNMMMNRYNNSKNGSLDANVYVQIEPIKNLRFKTVYGISYGASEYRSYTPKYQFTPQTANTVSKVNQSHGHGLSMVWTIT